MSRRPGRSRPALIVALTLGAGAMTSCGSSAEHLPDQDSLPSSVATTAATTQTTVTTSTSVNPDREHTWTLVASPSDLPSVDTGERLYQAKVRVSIGLGTVVAASSSPDKTSPGGLAAACDVDPAHDAFLPLTASLRNDSSFAVETTLEFHVHDPRAGELGAIDAGTTFDSDGPSCTTMTGPNEQSVSLNYSSIAPDDTAHHDYLLVLHSYFSPNFDSKGNRFGLRHLIGSIGAVRVQVAGDDAGAHLSLDNVDCYHGTAQEGIAGPGVRTAVVPAFALTDGFDFAYGRDETYYQEENDLMTPAKDSGTGC